MIILFRIITGQLSENKTAIFCFLLDLASLENLVLLALLRGAFIALLNKTLSPVLL